jgi:adenosylcobinamide-GDP ribazoletransferase
MKFLRYQTRLFLIALQFFTRIPLPSKVAHWVGFESEWISRCTRFFPLIGLLVALAMSAFLWLALQFISQPVAVAFTLAFGVLLTGAFHEDGFADFCDGFGAGGTAARTVEIMRDSRIGAYGAIGLVLLFLIKFTILQFKPFMTLVLVLCIAHCLSRACAVLVMLRLPYVELELGNKSPSAVKPVASSLKPLETTFALLTPIAVIAMCFWLQPSSAIGALAAGLATAFAMCSISILWMLATLRRQLGGYTGDTLGATQQITEVALLVGLTTFI